MFRQNIKVVCWRLLGALTAIFACMIAAPAEAHIGTGLPGGFASGFRHPFTGIDHLLAMVAVGLWGAFLKRPLIYVLPVIFPLMMVFGAIFGMYSVPWARVEMGVAASVLVLGCCILFALRAPVWLACSIVAGFALFHGYAHGKELPSAADPIGYSVGFVLATGSLHILGITVGLLDDVPGGKLITRALGGIIAGVGSIFVYQVIVS